MESQIHFKWCNLGVHAVLSYVNMKGNTDLMVLNNLADLMRKRADEMVAKSISKGYQIVLERNDYEFSSNINILNNALVLLVANKIDKNPTYVRYACENFNYILGKNAMGNCYVTGYGTKFSKKPCMAYDFSNPTQSYIPGFLCAGPNINRNDEYLCWHIPINTPPAKCYIDSKYAFNCNITASAWNAILLAVSTFLEDSINNSEE